MNEEYKKAPDILTGKDLDYLKDIFGWNHTSFKLLNDCLDNIEDKSVFDMISESTKLFEENMRMIIKIAKDGIDEE